MPVTRSTTKKLEDDEAEIIAITKDIEALEDFENELEKEWASQKDKFDRLGKEIDKLVKRGRFDKEIDELKDERLHALEMMQLVAKYSASSALSRVNGHEELRRRAEEKLEKKLYDVTQERERLAQKLQKRSSPQQMASP